VTGTGALSLRSWKILAVLAALATLGAALFLPLWFSLPRLFGREELEPALHAYGTQEPAACAAGTRPGSAGASVHEQTPQGVQYAVKAPANYDPTRAHPLVVVFAPHGANRFLSERLVGLTRAATRDGFVVAYADSRVLDPRGLEALGGVAREVAARWCIDTRRIFFTGHSDGGTAAVALVVLGTASPRPAAIAPSAAGFRAEDLAAYACPAPLPVMVLHSRADELFPGFGRGAAQWWAACNGCTGAPSEARPDGCAAFGGCRDGAETLYCEGGERHAEWPDRNRSILEFFRAAARPEASQPPP
jgi:polyhydroxybutyrate depolymerase